MKKGLKKAGITPDELALVRCKALKLYKLNKNNIAHIVKSGPEHFMVEVKDPQRASIPESKITYTTRGNLRTSFIIIELPDPDVIIKEDDGYAD